MTPRQSFTSACIPGDGLDGSFSTDVPSRAGSVSPASRLASLEPQTVQTPTERLSPPLHLSGLVRALCEPVIATALLTLALSLFFVFFPVVDQVASAAFHHPVDGFVAAADPALRALRKSSSWVMGGLLIAVMAALAISLLNRGAAGTCVRRPVCLLIAFVVGPGLLINGILKSFWGRARPVHVTEFGGTDPFTPAWAFSTACASNCSFTSGEGGSAAWMALVLLLVPPQWRVLGAVLIVPYAIMLSLNRIAFGGHFLSDVVLSWCLTGLVAAIAWRLVQVAPARSGTWPVQALWRPGGSVKAGS